MKPAELSHQFDETLKEIADLRLQRDGVAYYNLTFRYGLGEKPRYLTTLTFVDSTIKSMSYQAKILDIGCDIGLMAILFNKMGLEVSAIDKIDPPSESKNYGIVLKEILRSNNITFKKCDLLSDNIPFSDETFDFVYMGAVFEHLPFRHKKVIEEAKRVLKSQGYLIIDTPNIAQGFNRLMLLMGKPILPSIEWFYNSNNYDGHFREFTLNEMRSVLNYSGFEVVKDKMLRLPPFLAQKYEKLNWDWKTKL
jgi:ubiquinone/menaquinone biosynthesis C-methylase UbiE